MTRPTVAISALARRDIETHHRWLMQEAGAAVADRFVVAVDRAFHCLAESPGLGPNVESENPQVALLRKWKVAGFPNVIVYYQRVPRGVSIVRVIHAAQDWWRLIDRSD